MYRQALNNALTYACERYGAKRKWGIAFGGQTVTTKTSTRLTSPLSFKKLPYEKTPLEIFSQFYKQFDTVYLLESIEGPKKLAQFSFIGFSPKLNIEVKNGVAVTRKEESGEESKENVNDPLDPVKSAVSERVTANKDFRFAGGAVGYISYDAVRYWERLPQVANDDSRFPDLEMGIFDDGIVFDHRQRRAYYYYYEESRLPQIQDILKTGSEFESPSFTDPSVNTSQESYERAVSKTKEYIAQGDIFQAVISKRFDFMFTGDLIDFYSALRRINPSPYMYFYKSRTKQIIGSSPEMLARVENRVVETFPIAGTRPVSEDKVRNRQLARELLADPKERAEHVMLVDLARNDVGKISKFGSVRVPEFMKVKRYSHVQHIVSHVVGDLKEDCDSYDALKAVFPAGTVSGAPKVRAMEIIEELEPTKRGPYAGALGYFSYNGNSDFAITIRTLFAHLNRAYIQAGAGIVADSIPEREWFETEQKAGALIKALKTGGGNRN